MAKGDLETSSNNHITFHRMLNLVMVERCGFTMSSVYIITLAHTIMEYDVPTKLIRINAL